MLRMSYRFRRVLPLEKSNHLLDASPISHKTANFDSNTFQNSDFSPLEQILKRFAYLNSFCIKIRENQNIALIARLLDNMVRKLLSRLFCLGLYHGYSYTKVSQDSYISLALNNNQ